MPQVSIREAARLLGCSADTVKRRVRSGALRAEKGHDGAWLVHLPEAGAQGERTNAAIVNAPRSAPGELVAELRARIADKEAEVARLAEALARRDQEIARRDEQVDRLTVLLQAEQQQVRQLADQRQAEAPAQASRPWWRWGRRR